MRVVFLNLKLRCFSHLTLTLLFALLLSACDAPKKTDGSSSNSSALSTPTLTSTTPASPGNSNNPTINGQTSPNLQVGLYLTSSCTTAVATTTADTEGYFSFTYSVADNSITTFYAKATDGTNSTSCSNFIGYAEDSLPPLSPTGLASSPASPSTNNNPVISGVAVLASTARLYSNSSCTTLIASGIDASTGAFSYTVTVADNSATTFYATAVDQAGNESPCSTSSVTYVESSGPVTPYSLSATPASPANNNNPTINGLADANYTVTLYSNSSCTTVIASGTTNGAGSFSIPITVSDNSNTSIYANSTNGSQTSLCSSTAFSYIEDSSAPGAPTSLATSPVSPSNSNNPNITGSAEASSNIKIYSDSSCSTQVATGTTSAGGTFSVPVTVASNSTTTFYTKATDAAGNIGVCSTSFVTYIEDSIAPTAPTSLSVSPTSPANDNNPIISGTAEANSSVQLFSNSTCTTSLATGSASAGGTFSISIAVADNTTTSVYARATDAAGNASSCSTSFVSYQEDSNIPTAPIVSSVSPTSPANNNTPSVSGTAAAGATVVIFTDNTCSTQVASGTATGGNFNIPVSVVDDSTTTFYAHATFGALPSSCSTTSVTYVEDSTAPNEPTSFSSSPLSPSNNNTPNITGSAESNSSVEIFSDSSCTTSVATGSASSGGAFSIAVSVSANSTTTFYAKATDAAGNVSSCSSNFLQYVEDSLAPATPILSSFSPVSPSDNNNPTLAGTSEANSNVTLFSNSICTTTVTTVSANGAGNFSSSVNVADNATTTFYAKASDLAGNQSSCSSGLVFSAYPIAEGVAWLTGTQTIAGTNLNQTSSVQWNMSRFHSTFYSHSTSTNSHQLTVKVAGDYKLTLTAPVSGAVTRGSVQFDVAINGTAKNTAQSYAFTSNASGNTEGSAHLTVLLNGLAANDIITITTAAAGAAGTITATNNLHLYVENIPSANNIFYATGSQVVAGTNLNQATASPIQWTDITKDSNYTHSNSTNTQNITFNNAGTYFIAFNAPITSTVARSNVRATIKINGTTIPSGQAAQGYIRALSGHNEASLHWNGVVTVNANDILTIDLAQEATAGTVTVMTSKLMSLYIENISTTGVYFGRGTALTSNSNWNNTTTQSVRWTTDDNIDSSYFSHSTSSAPHQITITQGGDYEVYYSNSVSAATASVNFIASLLLNGTGINGLQTKNHYIENSGSHTESSGVIGAFLHNRSTNDVLTIDAIQEAAAGTVSTLGNASLLIRRKTMSSTP